jgi:hypothetical protein
VSTLFPASAAGPVEGQGELRSLAAVVTSRGQKEFLRDRLAGAVFGSAEEPGTGRAPARPTTPSWVIVSDDLTMVLHHNTCVTPVGSTHAEVVVT